MAYHIQCEVEQICDIGEAQQIRQPAQMSLIYMHFKINWVHQSVLVYS